MAARILVLAMAGVFLAFPQQAVADVDDGLVAHYPFNGNASDATGNGFDGTVIGATLSEDRFGDAESAYGFDGWDDYILIGQQPNFPSWPSNAVSLWFLNDGGGIWSGYGQRIINKGTYDSDFYAGIYPNGGVEYCTSMPWICLHYAEHDFRDGQWHHLAMNRDGRWGEMWVDGELLRTSSLMAASNTGIDITIGYSLHEDPYQQGYWSGQIDDVRIYDRVLTPPEVQLLFEIDCDGEDPDSDGLQNCRDNCTLAGNPDQRDTDFDNIGNRCDADFDQNCIVNFFDLRIMRAFLFVPGDFDTDLNGDGVTDFADLQIMKASFFAAPGPSGVQNGCDQAG